jgi:hypothetical protein
LYEFKLVYFIIGGGLILALNPEPISKALLGSALMAAGVKTMTGSLWNEEALLNGVSLKMVAINFVQGLLEGLIFGGLSVGFASEFATRGMSILGQHLLAGAGTGSLGNVSIYLLSNLAKHFRGDREQGKVR